MDTKYTVPIIPQNLYKHETIVQIADVVGHLTNISEDIFSQINKRLEKNTSKLTNISERVDLVSKKINTLRGAKKATQVFSSSKYPATDVYKEYMSVFCDSPPVILNRHHVKIKNTPNVQGSLEKLQFFHVHIQKNNETKFDGLGATPLNIEFVNDLLLFNSGKNLYKDFEILHTLNTPQFIKEDEEYVSEIGAAPQSISERSTLSKSHKQNYFYSPQIGEVPALDVPLDLPDLPGIANDLHYDYDLNSSIAPSADIPPSILELDFETSNDLPTIPQESKEIEELVDISVNDLPPLPEEPPVQLPAHPQEVQKPDETPVVMKTESKKQVDPVSTSTSSNSLPAVDDVRSNLMEAIRNAGGKAKLKSVQHKEPKAGSKVSQGGDLMADLHNKLFMRRKGISGAKQSQENSIDADLTLSRISSMIPPPEPKTDIESTSNDDEDDWD